MVKRSHRHNSGKSIRTGAFSPKRIMLALLATSILSACGEQPVFHVFQAVPKEGWNAKDTLCLEAIVPDPLKQYKLSIEVRHRNDYPYQNLNLVIDCQQPDSTYTQPDTLCLDLTDEKLNWKGKGWSKIYQYDCPMNTLHVTKSGIYTFRISHLMPETVLPGIMDVGICARHLSEEK